MHAALIIQNGWASQMSEGEPPDWKRWMFETRAESEARKEREQIATRLKFEALARISARKRAAQKVEPKKQQRVKRNG